MLTDLVVMDPVNSFQDGGERNLVCQCLWRDECSLGEGYNWFSTLVNSPWVDFHFGSHGMFYCLKLAKE